MFGALKAEHGISAYPEYVISARAAPGGMPPDTVRFTPSTSDRSAVTPTGAKLAGSHK